MTKKILITSDHAGYDLKKSLSDKILTRGYQVELLGATSIDPSDYPDDANLLAERMKNTNDDIMGIGICGSGIGISMALNRHSHIRAALCYTTDEAKLARQHNNANVLVLAGRKTLLDSAVEIVDAFLITPFDDSAERHVRRVDKLSR